MSLKYHVHTYRDPACNNEFCDLFGKIIPLKYDYVRHAAIGESWRTFCPECGDGAGWTLDSVSWDKDSEMDEVIITMTIPLGITDSVIGDGVETPYWKNDCEHCVWLGSRHYGDQHYDFYYCLEGSGDLNGVGIIREGNKPEDNASYLYRSMMAFNLNSGPGVDICDDLKSMVIAHLTD